MAFAGIIRKEEFEKAVEHVRNSDQEYYLNLIPKEKLEYFVLKAVVAKNERIPPALHKRSQDIYIVTRGEANFTYKGELVEPFEDDLERDFETVRGKDISNGESFLIREGDIISIPPNTPHSVDATDGEIQFITVKIDNVI